MLTNYCGEEGSECLLKAAVVCSNPFNLDAANKALKRTFLGKEVYQRVMGSESFLAAVCFFAFSLSPFPLFVFSSFRLFVFSSFRLFVFSSFRLFAANSILIPRLSGSLKELAHGHRRELAKWTELDLKSIRKVTYLYEFDREVQ
jgi:hypothetical protein